jgi:hypothetical protein
MMEGFGIHTFRFVNAKGRSRFVKFHWKPVLGVHSVCWDEAQKISGKDPDFHRRDLWEAIEGGDFPEWELGAQVVEEKDEHAFDFDLLDPTKLIPEELVPVQRIGRLTLNRNPNNFFTETEQVAFHPGHIVAGVDFSNDPLLQGRLFSYTDTQLSRLAVRISMRFRSIARCRRSITTSEMVICSSVWTSGGWHTSRTRWAAAVHSRRRGERRVRQRGRTCGLAENAEAEQELSRSLQPGHHVLSQSGAARAAAHHQCVAI